MYYYEVKIVSKGRDGYMGIGLSSQHVSTNRLPGWDKMSYGYHGDDGNAFCGSGTGKHNALRGDLTSTFRRIYRVWLF